MPDVKLLAAEAALKNMVQSSHMNICTIDKIVQMLDIKPDRDAYQVLHTLHCIDYSQMSPDLLAELPTLIHRVLNSPRFDASRINILESNGQLKLVKG